MNLKSIFYIYIYELEFINYLFLVFFNFYIYKSLLLVILVINKHV